MFDLLLRSLVVLVLFQVLALLVLWGERRGRGLVVAAAALAVLAGIAALQRSADPMLLLASAVVCGLIVGRAVRHGATVWRAALLGLLPVLVATTLMFFGSRPQHAWSELERQMTELSGAAALPPNPAAGPEERALFEQHRALAVQATTWTMRLLPAEIVAFDLVQVLVVVVLAGRMSRSSGRDIAVLPVSRWKLPFGVIWFLALGLGLAGTRHASVLPVGWNVVLVSAVLLALQGMAVLLAWLERNVSGPARWVVLGLAILTPLPFTFAGTALVGIADQWLDFRRQAPAANDS